MEKLESGIRAWLNRRIRQSREIFWQESFDRFL
jgi:hypothetical protein